MKSPRFVVTTWYQCSCCQQCSRGHWSRCSSQFSPVSVVCSALWWLVTLRCSTSPGIQRASEQRQSDWIRSGDGDDVISFLSNVSVSPEPRRGWSGAGWHVEISASHPDSVLIRRLMPRSSDVHQLMIFLQQKFDLTRTQKMYDMWYQPPQLECAEY